ncbi:VOC family protein [Haloferacaceae archaeon DSL9]
MTILVDDCDEALEYYTEVFPFEVLVDTVLDDGFRVLHVGSPEQAHAGLWLIEARERTERELVGNQTGAQPSLVLYTDDLAETHATLSDRGVTFTGEPDSDATSAYVHFEDLYGNHGILVEPNSEPA